MMSHPLGFFGTACAALTAVRFVRHRQRRRIRSEAVVLDCGSTASRGTAFAVVAPEGVITILKKFRLPELAGVLANGKDAPSIGAWIRALAAEVDEVSATDLVVGATGGLREALVDGRVDAEAVESFKLALHDRFGPRAHFQVLSGDDEASAELHGARYITGIQGLDVTGELGLVSGGGKTCQVATATSPPTFVSLVMSLKDANAEALAKGHGVSVPAFTARCEACVAKAGLTSLRGVFCVIETVGGLLASAGVGHRLVSRDEAIGAVSTHLVKLQKAADAASPSERARWTWKNVVQMNYAVEALAMLRMLAQSASVFACRWYKAADGATPLSGGWALGYYHALAQHTLEDLGKNVVPEGRALHKYGRGGHRRPPPLRRRVSSVVPRALKVSVAAGGKTGDGGGDASLDAGPVGVRGGIISLARQRSERVLS